MAPDKKKARRQRAHLVLIDETGLLMMPLVRRSLAPCGEPLLLEHQAKHREKVSLIAALTLSPVRGQVGLYFADCPSTSIDTEITVLFVRALLQQLRGRVIVLWDGGTMHQGPALRALLGAYRGRLQVERLPAYNPQLNPVEKLWRQLKFAELANFTPRDVKHLQKTATKLLERIQEDQELLRSFWGNSDLPAPQRLKRH